MDILGNMLDDAAPRENEKNTFFLFTVTLLLASRNDIVKPSLDLEGNSVFRAGSPGHLRGSGIPGKRTEEKPSNNNV